MNNRAIDRHESSITDVMDLCDKGVKFSASVSLVAEAAGLTTERLTQLVRTWCAVGGFEVPQ